ncbi:MAG TPA: hypothetical protein VF535_05790 [Allosphingosinicella sp.]|jgi:hypothetical protein
MDCRAAIAAPLAVAVAIAVPAPAGAQMVEAKNNFHAAVNGMASLCPALVEGGTVPDESASAPFGLRPITSPAGEHRFQSLFNDGMLQVWFEPARRVCTVHYGGAGYRAIAGVARDFATSNGFQPFKIKDPKAPPGDVFIRPLPDGKGRQQFIIVEDKKSQTASVAFFLKSGPPR